MTPRGPSTLAAVLAALTSTAGIHGATITPVGPPDRLHRPAHLNERGDLFFDLDTVLGLDYQPGDTIPTAEIWFADGTIRTIYHEGSLGGWAAPFGEDATTITGVRYARDPADPFAGSRILSTIHAPDGSPITYQGTPPYADFRQITPEGLFVGSASASPYLDGYDGYVPTTPITWSPVSGETLLPLPAGDTHGQAFEANAAGTVIGTSHSGQPHDPGRIVWWNDNAEVIGAFPVQQLFDADPYGQIHYAHITADGACIATTNGQIVRITPDGALTPLTEPGADGQFIFINDLNARGYMVGQLSQLFGPSYFPQSALWSPTGEMIDLQTLFPADSPWTLTQVLDITEDNRILVEGINYDGGIHYQAFIISGIPSPATALPLLAIPVLVSRRRA